MTTAILPPELRAAAPGLAEALRGIFTGLATLIARAFLRDPLRVGLILPLWNRLTRAARRADRLMARLAAGTAPRSSRPGSRSGAPARPRPTPIPAARAWLLKALRHEGAHYTNRLERLLAQPDIAALVAHSPQAARLLRPICHILGVTNQAVAPLPRRRRRPAPVPARTGREPGPGTAARPAAAPPAPSGETAPCPHQLWPWFPRNPPPAPQVGPALRRLRHGVTLGHAAAQDPLSFLQPPRAAPDSG